MISRRRLFRAAGGAGLALAAPAIIRTAGLLMPIKPLVVDAGPPILWPQVGYPIVAWHGQSNWVGASMRGPPSEWHQSAPGGWVHMFESVPLK